MPKVEIYVEVTCRYCFRAKRLLDEKGVDIGEYVVDLGGSRDSEEMVQRAGGRTTVPQIFIDGEHIGGCDDLYRARTRRASSTSCWRPDMARIALFQSQTGSTLRPMPSALVAAIDEAAAGGAAMLFTPEMSGLLDRDRERALGNVRRGRRRSSRRSARGGAQRRASGCTSGRSRCGRGDGKLANRGVRDRRRAARSARATTRSICSTSTCRPAKAGASRRVYQAGRGGGGGRRARRSERWA